MKRWVYITAASLITFFFAHPARAALVVECAKRQANGERGDCQLADFVQQFVILQQWALGFVVVLAVLMFVWAGFQFITAGGRSDKVESGKKIIGGTITGIIIAFSSYVIINYTVFALTGTSTNTKDFFAGPIAVLFPGESSDLKREWSGLSSGDTRTSCRSSNNSSWDKSCEVGSSSNPMQIYCSDPGDDDSGTVYKIQERLAAHGCNCFNSASSSSKPDGCYGPDTTRCVQYFQVWKRLPPTGMVDSTTLSALNADPSTTDCGGNEAEQIVSKLPAVAKTVSSSYSATTTGCCAVGSASNADTCLNNVTEKTCAAISSYSPSDGTTPSQGPFEASKDCSIGRFKNVCGYCRDADNNTCYQYVSEKWCKDNGSSTYIWTAGPSTGVYQCKTALLFKTEK